MVAAIHSMNRRVCELSKREFEAIVWRVTVVVVLKFYITPTATIIGRRDYTFKSHLKDWKSQGSNSLVHKARSLTTTPQRLLGE